MTLTLQVSAEYKYLQANVMCKIIYSFWKSWYEDIRIDLNIKGCIDTQKQSFWLKLYKCMAWTETQLHRSNW